MSKMVLLRLPKVRRELGMMHRVMRAVIYHVYTTNPSLKSAAGTNVNADSNGEGTYT